MARKVASPAALGKGARVSGRPLLPPPSVEAAAGLRHLDNDRRRRKAIAVPIPRALADRHEGLRAHEVDVAQRAAGIGREAEAEDRADIGLARIGDDALLDRARRFERLRDEEAQLQLRDVEALAVVAARLKVAQARPEPL